jgi:hypothetical protein
MDNFNFNFNFNEVELQEATTINNSIEVKEISYAEFIAACIPSRFIERITLHPYNHYNTTKERKETSNHGTMQMLHTNKDE